MRTFKKTKKQTEMKNTGHTLISEEIDGLISSTKILGPDVTSAIENLFVLDSNEAQGENLNSLQESAIKWKNKTKMLPTLFVSGTLLILIGVLFSGLLSFMSSDSYSVNNSIIFNNINNSLQTEVLNAGSDGLNQFEDTILKLPKSLSLNKQDLLNDTKNISNNINDLSAIAKNINDLEDTIPQLQASLKASGLNVTWNKDGFENLFVYISELKLAIAEIKYQNAPLSNITPIYQGINNQLVGWYKNAPQDRGWTMFWQNFNPIYSNLKGLLNGQSVELWNTSTENWKNIKSSISQNLFENNKSGFGSINIFGLILILLGLVVFVLSFHIQRKSLKINEQLVFATNEKVANLISLIMIQLNEASHGDLSNIEEINENNAKTLKGKIIGMLTDLSVIVSEIKRFVLKTHDVTHDAQLNTNILVQHNLEMIHRMEEMSRQSIEILDGLGSVEKETHVFKKSLDIVGTDIKSTFNENKVINDGILKISSSYDEFKSRLDRLLSYNQDITELGHWIQDLGDHLEVLSIQSQMNSFKNQSNGNGFKIIAEEMMNWRKQIDAKAEKILSVIQTIETDSKTIQVNLDKTSKTLKELHVSTEDKNDQNKKFETVLLDVDNFVSIISKHISSQGKNVTELKAATGIISKMNEEDKDAVTNAIRSLNSMTETVKGLGNKTKKFKVK